MTGHGLEDKKKADTGRRSATEGRNQIVLVLVLVLERRTSPVAGTATVR